MAERKVWVLDTSTKGTGAQMVPLKDARDEGGAGLPDQLVSPAMRRARRAEPPRPRAPRRFRVVDVVTRRVLAEDADLRATLAALAGVRKSVDVNVHVWQPEHERWRLLTLAEQQALWERRGAATAGTSPSAAR
jgi:hypothetical protein